MNCRAFRMRSSSIPEVSASCKKISAKEDRHDAGGRDTHDLTAEQEPREPMAAARGHDDQIASLLRNPDPANPNTTHVQISKPSRADGVFSPSPRVLPSSSY